MGLSATWPASSTATRRPFAVANARWSSLSPYLRDALGKKGGRLELAKVFPGLDDAFTTLIHDYTAGDPMRPGVRWTNLSLRRIREDLIGYGFRIGVKSVKPLL